MQRNTSPMLPSARCLLPALTLLVPALIFTSLVVARQDDAAPATDATEETDADAVVDAPVDTSVDTQVDTQVDTPPPPPPPLEPGTALDSDGPTYPIDALELRYLRENPLQPPIMDTLQLEVTLGQTTTGYVEMREGLPPFTLRLADIADRPVETYHASALQHILEALRDHFVAADLLGVYVAPDPTEINEIGEDLRRRGSAVLEIVVTTGVVTELRTVASGERVRTKRGIHPDERINNPAHQRIVDNSPIRPHSEGDDERSDLLRKEQLDRYLFHLGRHPGRRVDASVSAAQDIGGIALDYMVTENNPLTIYAQAANTGTRGTDTWRERFGLFHTQFTNSDDILSIDYTTASFDEVHALTGAYERPFANDRIRWRVFGAWSEYSASEVGFFLDIFEGETWYAGGEIVANIYQENELFIDLVGGARYEHDETDNRAFLISGSEDFFIPYVGVRLDRTTEWFSTRASALLEFQIGDVTDVDELELVRLGRVNPDEDFAIIHFNGSHSFFLEPFLDREAWEDPNTPKSSTLAHEIRASVMGQYAFGSRLIPQHQMTAGGLYTVRGYPQSVIAGDSAIIGTVEYRFHLPRAFGIQSEPGEFLGEPFRWAPQHVYGSPDWDLILKAFLDAGRVSYSDAEFFEEDTSLVSLGVGLDFLYRRNLNLRVDWGFVMNAIGSRDVNSGSNRVHFVGTILF